MIEKAYQFGKDGYLVGVVTEPGLRTCKDGLPAVLLLNAGLLHRVGPYRLHVDLARKLASLGFVVFRFDLGGIGDSQLPKGSRSFEERAVGEIREAMNFLSARKGASEFVLMGLCSGAMDAHQVTVVDPRVSGIALLDGYTYPTWCYYLRYYGPRVFSFTIWKNFLKHKWSSVLSNGHEPLIEQSLNFRNYPPKETVKRDLEKLVQRGVNLLYVYTGGKEFYNYRDQFKDVFRSIDFRGKLQLEYFIEADHTFSRLVHRNRLVITICDWMQAHYRPTMEQMAVQPGINSQNWTGQCGKLAPI
jgi:hypothetical protein